MNPYSLRKTLRALEIARVNRLPVINLVESGGADLPTQSDLFVPARKIFHDLTELSAMGIPSVALVFGNSTAGGAYVPGMCDHAVLVGRQAKVFLGGPPLVTMATGEDADDEQLGGADMHSRVSGLSDHFALDERDCIRIGRGIVAEWGWRKLGPGPTEPADEPLFDYSHLAEITDRRYPGFPIAEVAADGDSVITKHPDTGGLVSPGTVTAQLLYEIGDPAYANPDVIAHFDTIRLEQVGTDRVRITGTRGSGTMTDLSWPARGSTLTERFQGAFRVYADRVAVTSEQGRWTYREVGQTDVVEQLTSACGIDLCDAHGNEVGGRPGECVVRGPSVMSGYVDDPETGDRGAAGVTVGVRDEGHVRVLALDRPERLNALTPSMADELEALARTVILGREGARDDFERFVHRHGGAAAPDPGTAP